MSTAMTELHVSLPSSLDDALRSRVELGGYVDAPEYVRDLLRRDLTGHAEERRWLKAMIDEGLASGVDDREIEEVFADIMAEDSELRD